MDIQESKLVLVTADLAGYARACAHHGALDIAHFLDGWYRQCADVIRARGGRVVKFIGDACLAVFPEDRAVDAIDAATSSRPRSASARHLARRARRERPRRDRRRGRLRPPDDARYDVLGSGVNHLFLMGGGAGIRISEPVFRQLPTSAATCGQTSAAGDVRPGSTNLHPGLRYVGRSPWPDSVAPIVKLTYAILLSAVRKGARRSSRSDRTPRRPASSSSRMTKREPRSK